MLPLLLALLVAASTAPEEAQIHAVHEAFARACTKGDADAAAAVFVPDGIRVDARGGVQRGAKEIRAAYAQAFSGPLKGSKLALSDVEVRVLSDRFALWRGRLAITRGDGTKLFGYAVDLMEKRGGRWAVAESHPKLFL